MMDPQTSAFFEKFASKRRHREFVGASALQTGIAGGAAGGILGYQVARLKHQLKALFPPSQLLSKGRRKARRSAAFKARVRGGVRGGLGAAAGSALVGAGGGLLLSQLLRSLREK